MGVMQFGRPAIGKNDKTGIRLLAAGAIDDTTPNILSFEPGGMFFLALREEMNGYARGQQLYLISSPAESWFGYSAVQYASAASSGTVSANVQFNEDTTVTITATSGNPIRWSIYRIM